MTKGAVRDHTGPTNRATPTAPSDPQRSDGPVGLAISTTGLTKRFGSHTAVDGIDLAVPRGSVFGFLGPNGSGKTTTIRMLLGLVQPSAGTSALLGHPMPAAAGRALPQVGSLVEGPAFHPYLSGRANLARLDSADLQADPRTARRRVDSALERVGLLPAATKRYRAYSLGMRQRLAIAAALLMPRDLLVLDEPTNGLDPQGTREVRHLIGDVASDGTTVFVSSHLLSEVEQICTHLGVMSAGRLVAQGTTSSVRGAAKPLARVTTAQPEDAVRVLTDLGLDAVSVAFSVAGSEVSADPGALPPEQIVAALVGAGVGVRSFVVSSPSLEDLFVSLTGEGFDVSG